MSPDASAYVRRQHGLIVVEGLNDVIHQDSMEVPAVAICSNEVTEEQAAKIARCASEFANRLVTLFFDCEPAGDRGAKEAAWKLLQFGVKVRTLWSEKMHAGEFQGQQPEYLSRAALWKLLTVYGNF